MGTKGDNTKLYVDLSMMLKELGVMPTKGLKIGHKLKRNGHNIIFITFLYNNNGQRNRTCLIYQEKFCFSTFKDEHWAKYINALSC